MNDYRFEDIFIGLSESFEWKITREMVISFASLSGDLNPLHTNPTFARNKGFNDVVVHGCLTSSAYSRLAGMFLPGKKSVLHEIQASFNFPVYPNDILTVFGEVYFISNSFRRIEIKGRIKNSDNVIVSKGKLKIGFNE